MAKLEAQMLDALARWGNMTSHEASAVIGRPVNQCSAILSEGTAIILLIGLCIGGCVANTYAKRPQAITLQPGQVCVVPYDGPVECKEAKEHPHTVNPP